MADQEIEAGGYDESFLDVRVPFPRSVASRPMKTLMYPRFSVSLDTSRRLAAVTGVNIDGATLQDLPRTGEWHLDPRVSAADQAGGELYARNDLDRGHLVRRRDPGWGTAAQARTATEATFVYTNAAPQAAVFNQSKDLWVGLEDHVLEYADSTDQRVAVFTGPVFEADDPEYRGIQIPRRFWKVAAWTHTLADGTGSSPAAAGFVLDQSALIRLTDSTLASAPLGSFRTFQVPISDIAVLAEVAFGPLVEADAMTGGASITERWNELNHASQIRL